MTFQSVSQLHLGLLSLSSKFFTSLEGHAGDPVHAGLVLELQTWRCDASTYLFFPASCLLIQHCLPWAWSDVHPLLPLAFSPISSPNYTGMFMQFGVLIFKTCCGNKLPQNCPCIVLCHLGCTKGLW